MPGLATVAHKLRAYKTEIESAVLAKFPDAVVKGPYNGDTGDYDRGTWDIIVYLDIENSFEVYDLTRDIESRAFHEDNLPVAVLIETKESLQYL